MLRVKSRGKVVFIRDKYFAPFHPAPKPMKPTPGVVYPYLPSLVDKAKPYQPEPGELFYGAGGGGML